MAGVACDCTDTVTCSTSGNFSSASNDTYPEVTISLSVSSSDPSNIIVSS